jgi:hypothetical protein
VRELTFLGYSLWLITDSGVVTEERSFGCHGLSTTRARKRLLQNGLRTALGTWIAFGKLGTRLTTLVSTKSQEIYRAVFRDLQIGDVTADKLPQPVKK